MNEKYTQTSAKWIWYPEKVTCPNTFVKARKVFTITKDIKSAKTFISADSRYKLFINGSFIIRGPAPYDPRYMYYDKIDIKKYLLKGKNVVSILGYYIGLSSRDYVRPHDFSTTAGIIFKSNITFEDGTKFYIYSNKDWKVKKAYSWKSGTNSCAFSVLPMNEIFDARKFDPNWINSDYDDANWKTAKELDIPKGKPTICSIKDAVNYKDPVVRKQYEEMMAKTYMSERDIEILIEEKTYPEKITLEGQVEWLIPPEQYFSNHEDDSYKLVNIKIIDAIYRENNVINVEPCIENKSKYFIFDFAKEIYGRVFFEVEAPEGTVIEVLVSEVIKDSFISPENNFNTWFRYICTSGRQSFEFFEPIGYRYTVLMVRNNKKEVKIQKVGSNIQNYPFKEKGSFGCSDKDINKLWEIGKRTQKLCCQDTIFDNPFRERTQYSGDVEFNMTGIYYQFGEYKLARKSLIQLAQSQGPFGNFLGAWPSGDKISRIKEAYFGYVYWKPEIIEGSMYWLISLWKYYLFSGDLESLKALYPTLMKLKQRYKEMIGNKNYIFSSETWFSHFYGDHIGFKSIDEKILGGNLFYKGFIDTFYKIARELTNNDVLPGLKKQSEKIKNILIEKYWSEKKNGFFVDKDQNSSKFNILVNVYALLFGSVPEGKEKEVADNIKKHITPTYPTPLMYGMVYLALASHNDDGFIQKELKNKWAKMQSIKETGTFSELWFSELNWAVRCQNVACPNFILPGVILGVNPLKAGFKKFEVKPCPGFIKWAKGIVPTPLGEIHVEWEKVKDGISLEVKAPEGFKLEKEEIINLTKRRIYKYYGKS